MSFKKLGETFNDLTKKFTLSFALTGILNLVKDIDSQIGDFAKSMNMSYGEASRVKKEFSDIALASGDSALNSARLMETQAAIGAQLGSNAKLNEADLKTFTKLREQAGFTNDELVGIQKLSLVNNKTLEENTIQSFKKLNTLMINGDISFTKRWKLVGTTNIDIKSIKIINTRIELTRDMHCWGLSFMWVPTGLNRYFQFRIFATSSMLSGLEQKFTKPPLFF
jgi:hypothetical protein